MRYCYLLMGLLLALPSQAQQAAAAWYLGGGAVLDFVSSPARLRTAAGPTAQAGGPTYTNAAGQVLLSVAPNGLYGRNGQLLPGGQFATPSFSPDRTLIVPAPGPGQRCYVFYLGPDKNPTATSTGSQVNYSLVDLAANNGAGTVVSNDQLLYANLHGSFVALARCAGDEFWLVGEANRNQTTLSKSDQLLAYRVTAAGVAAAPVVSEPASIGHSYNYRASPAGDLLAFNYDGNTTPFGVVEQGLAIASFDAATGAVGPALKLAQPGWVPEFSPSGRLLYLVKSDSVVQYDVSSRNAAQIRVSRVVLSAGPAGYRTQQLAPDGRIYLATSTNKLARINFPELSGPAAGLAPNVFSLANAAFLPNVAAHLLSAATKADAGPDQVVCESQTTQLHGAPAAGAALAWSPGTYLSSTTTATPTFHYTGPPLTDTLVLAYSLSFLDGGCTRQGLTRVTVLPTPAAPVISGSQSVCPGVAAVVYRVPAQPGYTYQWSVSGGTLVGGQGTATCQVTWGPTNSAAQVRVVALNARQCPGLVGVLPVRVQVVLQPPTPQGPGRVCLNQRQKVGYEVPATTGSSYTWAVEGGQLTAGQGTGRVSINWDATGTHAVRVSEQSTTIDTVCYGTSAPLLVTVFQDSTRGRLLAASIGPATDAISTLTWTFSQALPTGSPQQLRRRVAGAATWQLLATLPSTARTYQDSNLDADQHSYEYLLQTTNACGEPVETPLHRTVQLTAAPATGAGPIRLAWNAYLGWPAGVTGYELWRRLDNESTFTRLRQLSGTTLALGDVEATAGFVHQYRLRALTLDATAWSNTVDLAFEHSLVIPNIFTPNGDGHNDTFFIPNLATLYPDNTLAVFDRWGKQVFEQQAYQGTWSGAGVAGGLYYYYLHVSRLKQTFKGWVQIIK